MRYRIITDGLTHRVQGEVKHHFLWWKWGAWYDCTAKHSRYFDPRHPLGEGGLGHLPFGYDDREAAEAGLAVLQEATRLWEEREAKRRPWRVVYQAPDPLAPREGQPLDEYIAELKAEVAAREAEYLRAADEERAKQPMTAPVTAEVDKVPEVRPTPGALIGRRPTEPKRN